MVVLYLWCPPCSLWTTTSLLHPHISRDQLAPRHPPRSQTHILCRTITTCTNTCEFFIMFYIPVYFQFTRNDISLMATLRLLLYLMFAITFNLTSGWALSMIKYQMPMCLVWGIAITFADALFVAYPSPSTPAAHIYGFGILMGIGAGITL